MANWKDEIQKSFESGEKVEKEYECTYNGSFGYIAFTGKRLLFVSEKGLFKKTYTKMIDLPYVTVKGVNIKGKQILEVADTGGKTYAFDINDIPAQIVKDSLDKYVKN
jgi:hypothetical protein